MISGAHPSITEALQKSFIPGIGLKKDPPVRLVYDPSNIATLFQDAEGTIPVTAYGQPVGLMLETSGANVHASQTSAPRRPTYVEGANGKPCLLFDGIDDVLLTSLFNHRRITNLTSHLGFRFIGDLGNSNQKCMLELCSGIQGAYDSNVANSLRIFMDNVTYLVGRNGDGRTIPTPSSPNVVSLLINKNPYSSSGHLDGVVQFNPTAVDSRYKYPNGSVIALGAYMGSWNGGLFCNYEFYGAIVSTVPRTPQIVKNDQVFLGQRTGVTIP